MVEELRHQEGRTLNEECDQLNNMFITMKVVVRVEENGIGRERLRERLHNS